jgi:aspartyl-tRNA(Asn)/glutamyl-tRNA(Gln) amidotransferase subunit C
LPPIVPVAIDAVMSVDHATVRKIASLARIAVSDGEVEAMVIPNKLRLRDDVVTDGGVRDKILANAPSGEHGFFGVPKVIE